ncbi:PilI type IV pilus biogenesis protein [Salmonella enterica subsp. enterica serovar Corvallis]
MPQQHPGRLQILVVDAHCKRRLFSTKTPTDPDELARRFCTPDNCLVVVLRDNRFLFRLERAPGSHCRWHKGSSSRHQHLQDWLSYTQQKQKTSSKQVGAVFFLVKLTIAIAIVCVHLLTILI